MTISLLLLSILVLPPAFGFVATKRYTYICMEANDDLCFGISPGDTDPVYVPGDPYRLQVKSRGNNESKDLDYRKTRWDADYPIGAISLSVFDLYLSRRNEDAGHIVLRPSPLNAWEFLDSGKLRLNGTDECVTLMRCQSNGNDWCDPTSSTPVFLVEHMKVGSYLRLMDCTGDLALSQAVTTKVDCAVGCSEGELSNGVCDEACRNIECLFDGDDCATMAPTLPTDAPTKAPTISLSPSSHPTIST